MTEVSRVFALKNEGKTDREVSVLTGIPVNTIRAWRQRRSSSRARWVGEGTSLCESCSSPAHDFSTLHATTYAYLLGVYLGDGYLTRTGGSWTLRITLDTAYPRIVEECCETVAALRGRPVGAYPSSRDLSIVVSSTWTSWPCFLPQHGRGKKHERRIELAAWQRQLVTQAPGSFLRGLIHTDGWRGTNRVVSKGKAYEYPRYQFSNRSDHIRKLFTDACDLLAIEWRAWTRYHISVAKRTSVAKLDTFVGPKC